MPEIPYYQASRLRPRLPETHHCFWLAQELLSPTGPSVDRLVGAIEELTHQHVGARGLEEELRELERDLRELECEREQVQEERDSAQRQRDEAEDERDEVQNHLVRLLERHGLTPGEVDAADLGDLVDEVIDRDERGGPPPLLITRDPWEYDIAEREAIEHEPVSRWGRLRHPEV